MSEFDEKKITTDVALDFLAETTNDARGVRDFYELAQLLEGRLIASGVGSQGSVTLKLTAKYIQDDPPLFDYDQECSVSLPKKKSAGAMLYKTSTGHHSKDNPNQIRMQFEPERTRSRSFVGEREQKIDIRPEDE